MTEDYLRLALRLGRHVDGLVDAYYGPSELEDEVKAYAEGYRVCSSWVAGDTARFRRLLNEPLTPAELVA